MKQNVNSKGNVLRVITNAHSKSFFWREIRELRGVRLKKMAGFSASFGVGFEAFVVCGDLKLILSFSFRLRFSNLF